MRPWSHVPRSLCLVLVAVLALAGGPVGGQTPKRGGILNAMLAEDPPGFSVHESSTISGVWPLSPCYSNLVNRNLVFFLRRNYTDYCDEQVDRLIEAQSQELDRAKRLKLVWEIQRKLEADVARPMLGWRKEYFTQWPYVKNLVPDNALYK